jgi:leucyl-tRNA synthetase
MAYYTVAHHLQNGNMYGKEISSVRPEEMTDEVWDFVFCDGPAPKSLGIKSKSFHTLDLADAGDGVDDANFVTETANSAVMRLTKEISWMEEVTAAESKLRAGPPTTYADRVFENEMNIAIIETEKSYNAFMFRAALTSGFYDLQSARDEYRLSCGAAGMNRDLLWRFMDVQTRIITPICPHYAEHVWQKIMKKEGFAIKAGWPVADTPDPTLRIANKYLQDSIVSFRKLLQKQEFGSKKPKKGAAPAPPAEEKKMSIGLIYVDEHYSGWKEQCLRVLQSKFDSQSRSFAPDKEIAEALKECPIGQEMNLKQVQKLCMPFIKKKRTGHWRLVLRRWTSEPH